jgi:hypothetical protein
LEVGGCPAATLPPPTVVVNSFSRKGVSFFLRTHPHPHPHPHPSFARPCHRPPSTVRVNTSSRKGVSFFHEESPFFKKFFHLSKPLVEGLRFTPRERQQTTLTWHARIPA